MIEAELKLAKYFDSLMEFAENSSQSDQDSILLAGAMMGVAKVIYQKHFNPDQVQNLMDHSGYDLLNLIKPTLH